MVVDAESIHSGIVIVHSTQPSPVILFTGNLHL